MSVTPSDIKFYQSTSGLGGAFVATEITSNTLHNIFDVVSNDEAVTGDVEYRCIYVKNTNATSTLYNGEMYINAGTVSDKSSIAIGAGTSAVNGTEQSIANESTAPSAVSFIDAIGVDYTITLGDIPAGQTKAVWLKRTILSAATAQSNDYCILTVIGDTA